MARPVRGHPTARLQQEGAEELERDHQQEDQPDVTEGKDIADYNPDMDYEALESQNEQVAQDQREVNYDAEYAKMEVSCDGTLRQKMMPWDKYMGILQVHRA